ncbi:hypothetical protein Psta_0446 [Pirellula staleyi DSM 6068]|uniref:Uncharacterized protein n=1 Tax=Pirellula staleyi (strain ATCC 27377 / DSM 6068 / ICPB 4128) TaxID=530564 RepID=D2R3A3_PIRSD|nr:hypothetical protein [Pirellula staleyi]ADB15134.1 hypothetical protein Psta_0446 [Pirellula staleyi DSM 6068]
MTEQLLTTEATQLPIESPQAEGLTAEASSLPKQYSEAYRMKLAGCSMQEIADSFSVDRTTIWRWCQKVEAEAQAQIANEPVFNIIVRELARLTDLEEQARTAAENAKSDRAKAMYISEARRAAVSRQSLLLSTGIIPKVPDQIFRVTATMKPSDQQEQPVERLNREEAIAQIISRMQHSQFVT